jgi:DNA topoisomerase I
MAQGDRVQAPDNLDAKLVVAGLEEKGHQTSPPARYTEASLVKRLEEEGIGRPSTYAATVGTIQRRGYVTRQGKALVPSFTAFAVTRLLREHFGEYVEVGFTAEMEDILDDISNGKRDWLDFIRAFFRGDGKHPGLENLVTQKAGEIDYPFLDLGAGPDGAPVQVRIGRFGPYITSGEHKASIPADVAPADLDLDRALQIVQAKADGPRVLGEDPATGDKVYVMLGRFGPYVQLGETPTDKKADKPRRASLGRNHSEDTLTLEEALKLLSLPRELGTADDGEMIVANIGRFGPYIKKGDDFRSLAPEDDVYTVTLERAKELLAQEKKSMRRQRAGAKELKVLGPHPDSGSPVRILDGRYGPYVTDGVTNASLPKGTAPEALTMEEAKALLEARAGVPKAGRRTRGAAKKAAATKRAAKKTKRAAVEA